MPPSPYGRTREGSSSISRPDLASLPIIVHYERATTKAEFSLLVTRNRPPAYHLPCPHDDRSALLPHTYITHLNLACLASWPCRVKTKVKPTTPSSAAAANIRPSRHLTIPGRITTANVHHLRLHHASRRLSELPSQGLSLPDAVGALPVQPTRPPFARHVVPTFDPAFFLHHGRLPGLPAEPAQSQSRGEEVVSVTISLSLSLSALPTCLLPT